MSAELPADPPLGRGGAFWTSVTQAPARTVSGSHNTPSGGRHVDRRARTTVRAGESSRTLREAARNTPPARRSAGSDHGDVDVGQFVGSRCSRAAISRSKSSSEISPLA
jgi:hypothetical protein